MWFGKGVVVRGREGGGGETAGPRRSGAFPPSAVTTPWPTALRLFLQLGFLSIPSPAKLIFLLFGAGAKQCTWLFLFMCRAKSGLWSFLFVFL